MGFWNNLLGMVDKIDDIIYAPIKLITDWASEPLKRSEHNRNMEKVEREKRLDSELRMAEEEHKVKMEISKETEKIRILTEIEEWKKDQEFERMQKVSSAIIRFQKELTRLNVDAINEIGNMQLDLREKAQTLVYNKTIKYKELQDMAMADAMRDLKRIETEFANNESAQNILKNAVESRLGNIIDTAHNFLLELNNDIKSLNKNIDLLTSSGQKFIENHLDKFNTLAFVNSENKKLGEGDGSNVQDAEILD